MLRLIAGWAGAIILMFTLSSCAATPGVTPAEETQPPLRVGITADIPPLIFKQGDRVAGIEAELARLLAKGLDRPLEFVELPWKHQIPALIEGRTDIIMSGMSVTKARQVRVDFAEPYFLSGLLAAVRAEDKGKYNSPEDIMKLALTVGVVDGTTGQSFVRERFPDGIMKVVGNVGQGVYELKEKRSMDVFVHDAPSIIWAVSENEPELTAYWRLLNEESLAWAVRRDNQELKKSVNGILSGWKEDGTLDRILIKWMPYYRQLSRIR